MLCNLIKAKQLDTNTYYFDSRHNDLIKNSASKYKRVNEQCVIIKGKYLNYMSCGLAHEMVACFYNFCVMEKKAKHLTTYGYNFQ